MPVGERKKLMALKREKRIERQSRLRMRRRCRGIALIYRCSLQNLLALAQIQLWLREFALLFWLSAMQTADAANSFVGEKAKGSAERSIVRPM